jgi:hypothetical protein
MKEEAGLGGTKLMARSLWHEASPVSRPGGPGSHARASRRGGQVEDASVRPDQPVIRKVESAERGMVRPPPPPRTNRTRRVLHPILNRTRRVGKGLLQAGLQDDESVPVRQRKGRDAPALSRRGWILAPTVVLIAISTTANKGQFHNY